MILLNRLCVALLAFCLASAPVASFATDISQTDWTEADSSNTSAPPNGWPAGMLGSQVEPSARAIRGAIKRFWDQANATVTSGGSANVQTLTYAVAPAAYVTGQCFQFIVGVSNTNATTINVNSLGALSVRLNGAALIGGELVSGYIAQTCYDGTNLQLVSRSGGSGVPSGFTAGSIIFEGATSLSQDNANFFWDSTNHRLGIATASPAQTLDLGAGNGTAVNWLTGGNVSTNAGTVGFTANGPGIQFYGNTSAGSGAMLFIANGSERMRITSAGRVGINNGAPAHTLDIGGDINTTGNGTIGGGSVVIKGFGFQDATTYLKLMDNTFSTFQPLVVGSLSPGGTATAGSTTACFVIGQYVASVAGLTTCASDARLKDIIGPLQSATDKIGLLRPAAFSWKSDADSTKHAGFIAQDVLTVMPECVIQNPDGMYSIETNCLVAYNTKALQELDARLTHLENH